MIQHLFTSALANISSKLTAKVTRGQGLVEYALILVLIAAVTVGSLSLVGDKLTTTYEQISCTLSGGTMHQDNGNGNSNKCVEPKGKGKGKN